MVTVDKLNLLGFGRFSDTELEMGSGLNVIYGGNEAGKSTVHRFIEAMLFGFWTPNISRPQRESNWKSFRPWHGSRFAGELLYTWPGGRALVRRDFAASTVEVIDADSGEQLADLPVNSWGEPDFARVHWGCNKLVFRNTISISQLGTVTDSALVTEVKNEINNLAQSGGSGVSVDRAMAVLEAAKVSLKPRLDQTQEQWQQLAEQLETARRLHKEACQLELEKLTLNRELENTSREFEQVQKQREQARAVAARRKLARLEEFQTRQRELEDKLARLQSGPASIDDNLVEKTRQIENQLSTAREIMAGHTAAEREALRAYREVADKTDGFGAYSQYTKDTVIEISSACHILEKGQETIDEHRQQLENILAEVQRVAAQLATLPYFRPDTLDQAATLQRQAEGSQIHGSRQELEQELKQVERGAALRKFFRGMMLLTIPAIAGAAWLFTPLLGAVSALPLITLLFLNGEIRKTNLRCRALRREIYALDMEFHNSQRQREQAQRELETMFLNAGVRNMGELERKFKQFTSLNEQNRDLMREQKYLRSKLEKFEAEAAANEEHLRTFFAKVGLDPTDLPQALTQFRHNLEQLSELQTVAEQRQQQVEAARTRLDQSRQQVSELERQLRVLLEREGAKSCDELAAMAAAARDREQLGQQVEEIQAQISHLLEGNSVEQLQKQAAAAAEDVAAAESLPAEEGDTGQTLHQLQARRSQIDGRLEGIYAGLKPVPELEEAAEQARERFRRCQRQTDALEHAGQAISRLAGELSDQLAPELNAKVSQLVERITGGRYRDIHVSSNMAIEVVTPESKQPVPLEELSGGTVDQFYFACRMAVADLVTGNAGLPLLLDDSFVQYDDDRLERMLALLTELGEERQIILFTCQQRELEILSRLAPKQHNLIRLEV